MFERKEGRWGVLLAVAVLTSACSLDVFNPGAITEESLNNPTLMRVVVNGIANEFNQMVEDAAMDGARLSDELAGTGSYFETGRLRRGAIDWEETAGEWGQIHETIWTGTQAWARMQSLDDFDETTSELASRAWLLVGHAHRFFGELFCEVVYSTDNEDGSGVLPRTAAFDSALVAFDRAIQIGTAAGSAADDFVTAAHAGRAQALMGLGRWGEAVTAAQNVPTDFVFEAIYNQLTNSNFVHDETWDRAEVGAFGTYVAAMAQPDPRAPFTICGVFDNPADPKNSDVSDAGNGCADINGADGVTAHYRPDKYPDDGSEIPVATGVEMRLIEAEAALVGNDLTTFTDRINDVRDFYGLGQIAEPAAPGAREYPIAYDASTGGVLSGQNAADVDAVSILDGERHVTNWLEGRRVWDLHRWDHPFLNGGIVFWDAEPRRASCYPVPEQECQLNTTLRGATLLTGIGTGTQTCS